jgi:hypothetical protein
MKKSISILILSLVLLSGMHLSVANHICEGRNVATKVSFDEEKASCGMKSDFETDSKTPTFKKNCCHDEIADFVVDQQYQPTSLEFKKATFHLLSVFPIPTNTLLHTVANYQTLHTNALPPGNLLADELSLSRICVFRI